MVTATMSSQGILRSTHSEAEENNQSALPASGHTEGSAFEDANLSDGEEAGNLSSATTVAIAFPTRPPQAIISTRSNSISSGISGGKFVGITKSSFHTIKVLQRIVALVSFLGILISAINFWPSFAQYYYSKITYEQNVQSQNQTNAWQIFELKNKYYQTCQLNKVCTISLESFLKTRSTRVVGSFNISSLSILGWCPTERQLYPKFISIHCQYVILHD
jgi:hypothetical protein